MLRRELLISSLATAAAGIVKPARGYEYLSPEAALDLKLRLDLEAMQASRLDADITIGFANLQRRYLALQKLRRTVGLTLYPLNQSDANNKIYHKGSCILLDRDGMLALTSHQVFGDRTDVYFFTGNGVVCKTKARIIGYNKKQDIAFARLENTPVIEHYGLLPVTWGASSFADTRVDDVLAVGFPVGADCRIHATLGSGESFLQQLQVGSDERYCKSDFSVTVYPGGSGGACFNAAMECIGMFNATDIKTRTIATLTPAEVLQVAHQHFRYTEVGNVLLQPATELLSNVPDVCRFRREDYIILANG